MTYSNGKQALSNVSFSWCRGNLLVLIGHNGAGKTTTLNILTGLINSSDGKVLLNGNDILKSRETLRANLGVCPQQNVLFDYLTVREHLELFATLKSSNNTRSQVDTII
jgi:ATP-binding cassette subfamily A (ABC1) protein 3